MGLIRKGPITGLADAIEALRAELTDAMARGEGHDMRFHIKPIELMMQVAVTTGADGKIGWSVLGIGAERRSVTTQQLHLQLAPVWRRGDGSYVEDFTIADQSEAAAHIGPRPESPVPHGPAG
jgi:Trypsin-co-occurring domain 2